MHLQRVLSPGEFCDIYVRSHCLPVLCAYAFHTPELMTVLRVYRLVDVDSKGGAALGEAKEALQADF